MCIEAMYWAWRFEQAGANPLTVQAIVELELAELASRRLEAAAHRQLGRIFHNLTYANGKNAVKSAVSRDWLELRVTSRDLRVA